MLHNMLYIEITQKVSSVSRRYADIISTTEDEEDIMEFEKEKKRHLAYLLRVRPQPQEVQTVLPYSVEQFPDITRLEYMSFAEDNKLHHSWAALLAWWRYRQHTVKDKRIIPSVRPSMEVKKKEEYTLPVGNKRHRHVHLHN